MIHDGYRATLHESLLVPAEARLQATRSHSWAMSYEMFGLIACDPSLHLVEVKTYLSRGVRIYTFEGDRLPAWQRGTNPRSLPTLEALKQYRSLRRIYDIRWPGDVRMSSSVVFELMQHAGHIADLREDFGSVTGRRHSHIVDPDAESMIRVYGLREDVSW